MEQETYERLFELSFKTELKAVTPLIMYYYLLENLGAKEKGIVKIIENRLNPLLS
ncbi:MAG TPA: hypothetical protein VMC07_01630 [Candidatus Omnitrophota bacterium]|nr:hypothetical protein [Candidatus Omnitrophota bacterium]